MNLSLTARPDSTGFGGIFDIETRQKTLASLDEEMASNEF